MDLNRYCQPSCSYNAETESRSSRGSSNVYRRRNSPDQWRRNYRINTTASMHSAFEDDNRSNDKDGILKWEYVIFGIMLAISTFYLNKRFEEVFKFLHDIKSECVAKQHACPVQIQTAGQKRKHTLDPKGNTSEVLNELLKQTIEIYTTVKNRSVDFASAGGVIISTSGQLHNIGVYPLLPHTPDIFKENGPSAILQDSDHCWTFQGSSASTVIQLIGNISISGVSLGYLRKQSKENNSAPREFSVWGLIHAHDREGKCLGHFTYDSKGSQLQDFVVHKQSYYTFMELKIDSNYGNFIYTSVHRLHIYGELESKKQHEK